VRAAARPARAIEYPTVAIEHVSGAISLNFQVDIWLRGENHATTTTISGLAREPQVWTDDDVRFVLTEMLRAMNRQKSPGAEDPEIALRGLSWIVSPYEDGGVVLALEITLGAAVAGPFAIDKADLEARVTRVLRPRAVVH
jgi:hypothetical protein